jgi:hypothetical protein
VIEPRIYRAAFLPALLVVVVVMFSLGSRPSAVGENLAADVLFEGRQSVVTLREYVRRHPDRSPGSTGDAAAAVTVAQRFAEHGFETRRVEFRAQDRRLTNVVGRRVGSSRDQIVVLADRDARGVPDAAGSAADTAALLELARALEGRVTRKTVVLASVDGSTLGNVGAERLSRTLAEGGRVDAVLAISNLAAPRSRGPLLVATSNDANRGSIGLQRTAASALRQEIGRLPGDEGALAQLARISFPLGIGDQATLLEDGVEALRFSGSGELPPPSSQRRLEDVDVERYGDFGRAVLRTMSALDGAEKAPGHGPETYVIAARQVMPGWPLSLLALSLILPALVASVDAFARARRRREPVGVWLWWVLGGALPFVAGLVVAQLLAWFGATPEVPAAPVAPELNPFDGAAALALAGVAAAVALSWLLLRPVVARRAGRMLDAASPGAGCAVALVLSGATLAAWILNPYAALLLVPALHLWLLAVLADVDVRRPTLVIMALGGLVPLAAVALFYMSRLSLGPLEGLWYLFMLVVGHDVSVPAALLACVYVSLLISVAAIIRTRSVVPAEPEEEPERPRVFGPGGYAGPGSLGGTESALRR